MIDPNKLTYNYQQSLVKKSLDPVFGARPLKRLIQQKILNPLALMIVAGKIGKENNIVEIEEKNGEFKFRVKKNG